MYHIDYEEMLDKVYGGWFGKCLGGAAGSPVEGIKQEICIADFTEIYNPELPNDDLDLQLLWLSVLEEKGPHITSEDLADAWIKKCWYPFSEYGYFLKNYERNIKPPYTGIINNSFFKEGMGCPIRSEIWGMISAGNPKLAASYAYVDGCLDHAGDAIYAEQFLAVVESMAFVENRMTCLINMGLEYVPAGTRLYQCLSMVMKAFDRGCTLKEARKMVIREFSHMDFTNVVQNMGFIMIALLWGDGDMRKTVNIALQCGYDADCTCASAAAIVGMIQGYQGLNEEITSLLKDKFVIGIDLTRRSSSIRDLAYDVVKAAARVPNHNMIIENLPYIIQEKEEHKQIVPQYPTAAGLEQALKSLRPLRWEVYGPYFEQEMGREDTGLPSPHAEGSALPDIVAMVNNSVLLEKEYVRNGEKPFCSIDAYEDLIEIETYLHMKGQMCCYARAFLSSEKDQKVWAVIGNTDGFQLWCNRSLVMEKDEIRCWTPYNNSVLLDLKKGENEIVMKLLRRIDSLKISIGFRIYNGEHWHRCKWHTNLY